MTLYYIVLLCLLFTTYSDSKFSQLTDSTADWFGIYFAVSNRNDIDINQEPFKQ